MKIGVRGGLKGAKQRFSRESVIQICHLLNRVFMLLSPLIPQGYF